MSSFSYPPKVFAIPVGPAHSHDAAMEPDSGFARYAVEVINIAHRATDEQVHELFTRLAGFCSISYTPRSGKATVELNSRSNADAAVKVISTMRELVYSPNGQTRTLKARLQAVNANLNFTQSEAPQRWHFGDDSALDAAAQASKNDHDLLTLFDRLTEGGMKTSIQATRCGCTQCTPA